MRDFRFSVRVPVQKTSRRYNLQIACLTLWGMSVQKLLFSQHVRYLKPLLYQIGVNLFSVMVFEIISIIFIIIIIIITMFYPLGKSWMRWLSTFPDHVHVSLLVGIPFLSISQYSTSTLSLVCLSLSLDSPSHPTQTTTKNYYSKS